MLKVSDLDLKRKIDWSKAIPAEDSQEYKGQNQDNPFGWKALEYVLYGWEDSGAGAYQATITLIYKPDDRQDMSVIYNDDTLTDVGSWDSFISWCKSDLVINHEIKMAGLVHIDDVDAPYDEALVYPDECIVLAHRLTR